MSEAATSSVNWSETTEADLTRALQRRDPGAQRELWRRLAPVVRRIAWRVLRAPAELDDAVQEVFIGVFNNVSGLRNPEALRAFVLSVASRVLIRARRRRRRRVRVVQEFQSIHDRDASYNPWADTQATSRSAYVSLERLLSRLHARDRHAYVLHFVDGLKAADVAQALGVSVPTAKRSFGYAKKRIDGWALREPELAEYAQAAQRSFASVA